MILCQEAVNTFLYCDWFHKCNECFAKPTINCVATSDIKGIINQDALKRWESTRYLARGDVTEYLSKNSPEAYNKNWNVLATEARNEILPKIEPVVLKKLLQFKIPESAYRSIRTDIINTLLVLSYRDYFTSELFENILSVYAQGFIPCGWDGEYPEGNLIVFCGYAAGKTR